MKKKRYNFWQFFIIYNIFYPKKTLLLGLTILSYLLKSNRDLLLFSSANVLHHFSLKNY